MLPRLDIPDGPGSIHQRMYELRPDYYDAFRQMSVVLERSILSERLRELVRYRIVELNGCAICMSSRELLSEEEYDDIATFRESQLFSPSEKLAIEYAERFVSDHHGIDDDLWERLHSTFTDPEILDITFYTARYLAFSRMTHVLGLDDNCPLPGSVAAFAARNEV
jgi:alkylhydroperoxidase family enzyme